MGISTQYFKSQTQHFIEQKYNKDTSILDIGAGSGTYFNMLNPLGYNKMDCVEAFTPYILKFDLKNKYNNIFYGDVTNLTIDYSNYDLVILGDVFEHIEKKKSRNLLRDIYPTDIIIAIPFGGEQDAINGNIYEIHKQTDITLINFLEEYSSLNPLCIRFDYGVFTSKPFNTLYLENQEREVPQEYLNFIQKNYSNKEIKFV